MRKDFHTALKTEITDRSSVGGVNHQIVKLQSGKEDISYSIHSEPSSYSLSGVQTTDFLSYLGFQRSNCAFIPHGQCFTNWVEKDFPLNEFAIAFQSAYKDISDAERGLNSCGYLLDQPEGWGYFNGQASLGRRSRNKNSVYGDGHNSPKSNQLKESEDKYFFYSMSWIEGGRDKGWTFHYHPKHPPLSKELKAVMNFLGLSTFDNCPFFDFENCFWQFFPFQTRGDSHFDSNVESVHRFFDSHTKSFSMALEKLVVAHSKIQPFGFSFLNIPVGADFFNTSTKASKPPARKALKPDEGPHQNKKTVQLQESFPEENFDVAISFAGSDREYAEKLATIVRDAGFQVFYDNFYPEQLWGKDLPVLFDDIYRKRSRFCVIFVSNEYSKRMWTNHERKSAQARALEEKGKEYILPIRIDESELPGLAPTIGYLSINELSIEKISNLLISKLST